jgi:N-acetylglucosaminyldiphosphoundecaprenol N-acetyl-beta-D-mannosaminyltransferase
MNLTEIEEKIYTDSLSDLPIGGKILINTMNAHSFCVLQKDKRFQQAIRNTDYILSDGISIVWALRVLKGIKVKKVAGSDLFRYEMERLQSEKGKCFFLGSTSNTLDKIYLRAKWEYPDVTVRVFSPPFKSRFSEEDNRIMIDEINSFEPDVLFIGMTAPKQEKWGEMHFERINAHHICGIGAVFDFFAGTKKRAPEWMIKIGFEWFHRLITEPTRNWRRYIIGNSLFVLLIIKEKFMMILRSLRANWKSLGQRGIMIDDADANE